MSHLLSKGHLINVTALKQLDLINVSLRRIQLIFVSETCFAKLNYDFKRQINSLCYSTHIVFRSS